MGGDATGNDGDGWLALGGGPLPQRDFPEPLAHEVETQADGSHRHLIFPPDASPETVDTRWLSADAAFAIELEDVR